MEIKDFVICHLDCNYEEARSLDKLLGNLDILYGMMKKNDWDLYFPHCDTVLTSSDIAKMADLIDTLADPAKNDFYLQKS